MTTSHGPVSSEMRCIDLHDLLMEKLRALGVPEVEAVVDSVLSQVAGKHAILVGSHRFVDHGREWMEPPGPYVVPL